MQAILKWLLLVALALVLSLPFPPGSVLSAAVRRPVWAGRFYKADPGALGRHIDQLTRKAQKTRGGSQRVFIWETPLKTCFHKEGTK